jgi:hypothetical protein
VGKLAQLDTTVFANEIKRVGKVPERWFRRLGPCPRHKSGRNTFNFDPLADPDCSLCGNTGWLFEEQAVDTTGGSGGRLMVYQATDRNKKSPVELLGGDMVCSFMPDEFAIAEGDRFVLASRLFTHTEQIRLVPGQLAYPLLFTPVRVIEAVYGEAGKLDPATYSLGGSGTVLTFTGLPTGEVVTTRYRFRPTFVVLEGSVHHRETATNGDYFPSRCIFRLWRNHQLDTREGGY